jgi:retron-type reverse transcriptase
MARERNLVSIWRELRNETYSPSGYKTFTVYEPKERLVQAPKIRDKVVEFNAHRILREVYAPVFIKDSYACQDGKGAHGAVSAVQHGMRVCKWKNGGGWVVKLDVKKFFYSIDRSVLKSLLRKKINDGKFLRVLDAIIDSAPGGVGVPLGAATSQDFANITLNELDQYAKRYLGLKWYVRYMDDVIVVVPTREEAKAIKEKFIAFLSERLHLIVNDKKTKIFPIAQGVNAYGYKILTTHTQVRESSKRAMKRRMKAMVQKLKERKIKLNAIIQGVNSWLGHARHSNSFNLAKKLFGKYRFITVDHPEYYFGRRRKQALPQTQ